MLSHWYIFKIKITVWCKNDDRNNMAYLCAVWNVLVRNMLQYVVRIKGLVHVAFLAIGHIYGAVWFNNDTLCFTFLKYILTKMHPRHRHPITDPWGSLPLSWLCYIVLCRWAVVICAKLWLVLVIRFGVWANIFLKIGIMNSWNISLFIVTSHEIPFHL